MPLRGGVSDVAQAFSNRGFVFHSEVDARTARFRVLLGSPLKRYARGNLSHFRTVRTLLEPEHPREKMAPALS